MQREETTAGVPAGDKQAVEDLRQRYFTELGLFCLLDARAAAIASLRKGANH